VDLVTAQNTGIELERIFAGGLLDGGFDAKRKIERRHTFRIKSAAVDSGTIPGERLERPLGMVRPVTGRLKPQAKPPKAMRSRWSRTQDACPDLTNASAVRPPNSGIPCARYQAMACSLPPAQSSMKLMISSISRISAW